MPFKESSLLEEHEEKREDLPIDVHSPEKLDRYLSLKDDFSKNFVREKGKDSDLIEELDENKEEVIYRGMAPQKIFSLINGKEISVSPYKYESDEDKGLSDDDLQNASYLYSNSIIHGYDEEGRYNFLSAIGFSGKGLSVKNTGEVMVRNFSKSEETNFLPSHREKDVSVEGDLNLDDIDVFCFRFRDDKKFKTLVYRRKNK